MLSLSSGSALDSGKYKVKVIRQGSESGVLDSTVRMGFITVLNALRGSVASSIEVDIGQFKDHLEDAFSRSYRHGRSKAPNDRRRSQ